MPIWTSVQTSKDAEMLIPGLKIKRTQLGNVHHPPKLENYSAISAILQQHLYAALERTLEPAEALKQAKIEIEKFLGITPKESEKKPEN